MQTALSHALSLDGTSIFFPAPQKAEMQRARTSPCTQQRWHQVTDPGDNLYTVFCPDSLSHPLSLSRPPSHVALVHHKALHPFPQSR